MPGASPHRRTADVWCLDRHDLCRNTAIVSNKIRGNGNCSYGPLRQGEARGSPLRIVPHRQGATRCLHLIRDETAPLANARRGLSTRQINPHPDPDRTGQLRRPNQGLNMARFSLFAGLGLGGLPLIKKPVFKFHRANADQIKQKTNKRQIKNIHLQTNKTLVCVFNVANASDW
jgi:hypothetical protein